MKKNLLIIVLLFLIPFRVSFAQKYHRVKANINQEIIDMLFNNGFEADHFHLDNGLLTAEVSDADIALFKKHKIKFQYLIKDLDKNLPKINKAIDKQNAGKNLRTAATPANFTLGTYGGFFTITELNNILEQMRVLYPNLVSAKTSIGNTVEGRPIYMVKISDNADIDEPESELFLNAVHHGREPMSLSQLIYFMWHVIENYGSDSEITTLLNSTEIYIVPMVNPDGYQRNIATNPGGGGMWRKNRKNNGNGIYGVDINRNYDYSWGLNNIGSSPTTSSETYRGPSAFSEPETQAIRNFCNSHDFVASMDFHSYGNYCIFPYGTANPNNNPELSLFQSMGAYLTAENSFLYGNAYQTLHYYTNGSGEDWKYGEQSTKNKIYSFIPEIGASSDGFYPAQSRIIPLCESTLQMNRKILKLSSKFAELTTIPPTNVTSLSGNIPFNVKNIGLRNPSYTLSLTSSSQYVSSLTSSQTLSNMLTFQNMAGNLAYTLSPLTPTGTVIDFIVRLDNGHSPVNKTVSITYNCSKPTNLQNTSISHNSATNSWTAVPGATSYYYSFKTTSSSTWSSESLVNGTSFTITGLAQGTSYDWRVRANNCATHANSTFTTQTLCNSPDNVAVSSITNSSVIITWPAVSGASSYQVQYKLASSNTWISASSANQGTTYSLTGLTTNTQYNVQVRTNCGSENSTYIGTQFTTNCVSPTNLQNTGIGLNSATISWTAVNGATGYYFSYKTSSSNTWSPDSFLAGTSFTLIGLTQGTTYDWRVRSNNCITHSNNTFTTQTPCNTPLSVVVNGITSSGATTTWPAVSGASSYQVQYKLATNNTWITAQSANTSNSYALTGLTTNTLYNVQVRTICGSENSAYIGTQFTTANQTSNYCASNGNNFSYFWIDYFRLGTIARTSGADAGYFNGTSYVTNLTRGNLNTITFSPGYARTIYLVYWRVWIDFNKDGDFLDAGEQIVSQSTSANYNYSVTFTVPTTAALGNTRVRVSMKYGAYSTSCETFAYGEVEDYTVNIVTGDTQVPVIDGDGARVASKDNPEIVSTEIVADLYPNPVNEELFIDFRNQFSKSMKISILDAKGREKYNHTLSENHIGYGIDVSGYTPEVYFLILERGDQRKTIKFVKE